MTLVPADAGGVRIVLDVLRSGAPAVVPLPTPLPYVVAGRVATAVNRAKGRPGGQPAGMVVGDLGVVEPYVALDPDSFGLARRLAAMELLNLFLPVRDAAPGWLAPSTSGGRLGVTVACPLLMGPLLDEIGHLYLSSANRTGGDAAVTAAGADAEFAGALPVLDGDALRDPSVPSGSATIVLLGPGGHVEIVRSGVQDAGAADYLRDVLDRAATARG